MLPEIIKPIIFGLTPGEVTEPIRLPKAFALFQLRDIRENIDKNAKSELLDFVTVNANLSKLKSLEYIKGNFQNCSDLPAIFGDQTDFTVIRSKHFSDELPESIAGILKNLDSNEAKIILDDKKSKLVILCERNYQENSTIKTIENDKKVLQNTRLKYLARSLLETLKDDARIVIK
jgi:peptidyl-prolyl cis-trans isomerase SurA